LIRSFSGQQESLLKGCFRDQSHNRSEVAMDTKNVGMIGLGLMGTALILAAAATAGQDLPLTETHRRLLEAAEAAGLGDADNSAVIRAFGPRQ
jgi:lactate dehydrogenase-like 2-hydroxyacid dehydrogenase